MNKNIQEDLSSNYQEKKSNNIYDESGDLEFKDLTEVDIFSSKYGFDDSFVEKMLNPKTKWNEKKQAFDNLTECTDQSRLKYIKNTDRSNFIDMVKKLLKQPNINVIHSIINALNNLSQALTTNFCESKELFSILLNYLKEKKENIINSLINCLCNFSLYITDNIINDKLINYANVKNLCNLAKINLCTLIEKIIEKKGTNIQLNSYLNLFIKISKYLEDQNPEVREKSSKLMAFINYIKKDLFNSIANSIKLDNKKKNKIIEYEKLYINSSYNKNKQNNEDTNKKNNENFNSLNLNLKQKKAPITLINYDNLNPLNKKENNNNNTKLNNNILDDNKENLFENKEETISYIQKKILNLNNSLFNSLKWEERREGFSLLNKFINEEKNSEEINDAYDIYFKYIFINNKYFNEKNFLVLNESIHCINSLIEKVEEFTNKYYKIIISSLVDKVKEKKIFPEIQNLIEIMMKKISKKDIILFFINSIENKQINIIKDGIEMIKNIINKSNEINDFPLQEIISFCTQFLSNSNNLIKKSSIQLLCSIYQLMGEKMFIYLKNQDESILSLIKEEFNKISKGDNKINENKNETNDEIDISDKITEKMIKDLKEGKWFEKKNVIEQIEKIITQYNHNITSKDLNELFYAINNNLNDGNKNIVKLSIKLVSEFLDALLPGINLKLFIDIILSSLISNFSENKNSIKDLSVNCVNKIIELIGIESIINNLIIQLKTENFDIRNEILKIIVNNKDKIMNLKENKELVYSLINCLLDKNINIRNNSKILIQEMMQYISPSLITDYINTIKPSFAKQINDIIYGNSSNNVSKEKSVSSSQSQNPKTNKKLKSNNVISSHKYIRTVSKTDAVSPIKINNSEFNKYSTEKKLVSKSPILPSKSTLGEYKFNIIDVLPPEQNDFPNYIKMIKDGDIPSKIMALTEIKKLLIHFIEKDDFDINKINVILISFNELCNSINLKIKAKKEDIDKNEFILLRYLLDDYIYIANKKSLIISISDENLIYNCYEKLFILLSSDIKKSINNSSEIISILNTTILCLLTNFNKTLTISSLIKLISLYKSNIEYPLIVSLAIKCLDKFRKIISKIKDKLDNNTIFISLYNFFFDFSQTNKNMETQNDSELNALLMIKEFIKEYINVYGDNIWILYHNSLDDNMLKLDINFKRTIEILYKQINSEKISKDKININFGVSPNEEDNNEIINEILDYANELKNNGINMDAEQRSNNYYEIVSLLRINNLDISILQNKIDKDIMDKIFELYYGIKDSDESKKSIQISKIEKENNINITNLPKNDSKKKQRKEISEQSKRILEYKNKIKNLTGSDSFRNDKTSMKRNGENKQINNKNFVENNLKNLDEITSKNELDNNKSSNIINNEITNMKKKLEEIRKKIK